MHYNIINAYYFTYVPFICFTKCHNYLSFILTANILQHGCKRVFFVSDSWGGRL